MRVERRAEHAALPHSRHLGYACARILLLGRRALHQSVFMERRKRRPDRRLMVVVVEK